MRRTGYEKPDGASRATVAGLRRPLAVAAALLSLALMIPAAASGHAGEVHTDEPATSTGSPATPDRTGKAESGRKGAPDNRGEADGEFQDETAASVNASETPPPPEVPESNPTLHFLALGAIAIVGAGLLIVRRRRNAFG